jgi:hypothetical protein
VAAYFKAATLTAFLPDPPIVYIPPGDESRFYQHSTMEICTKPVLDETDEGIVYRVDALPWLSTVPKIGEF